MEGLLRTLAAVQVNFSDVAQNPRLARAARAELDGHAPGPNAFAGNNNASASRPHDAEVFLCVNGRLSLCPTLQSDTVTSMI